jgi:hypothetical protein
LAPAMDITESLEEMLRNEADLTEFMYFDTKEEFEEYI